jgi:hypothetical protein
MLLNDERRGKRFLNLNKRGFERLLVFLSSDGENENRFMFLVHSLDVWQFRCLVEKQLFGAVETEWNLKVATGGRHPVGFLAGRCAGTCASSVVIAAVIVIPNEQVTRAIFIF